MKRTEYEWVVNWCVKTLSAAGLVVEVVVVCCCYCCIRWIYGDGSAVLVSTLNRMQVRSSYKVLVHH